MRLPFPTQFSASFFLWGLLALLSRPAAAQYVTTPPVQDGVINAGEYPSNGAGNWYMAWDDTYLYIAKTGGQSTEPLMVYLDVNPLVPVNGGNDNDGSLTGKDDFTAAPGLPMRADARIYSRASDNYAEILSRNGSGGFTGGNVSSTNTANNPDISRGFNGGTYELRIRWAALTNTTTRPASFNWFGYQLNPNDNNFVFGQVPVDNYSGNSSNQPYFGYYNTVSSTLQGAATNPFGRTSYSYPYFATGDANNFGAISVYDFTMNTQNPLRYISRGNTGGNWNIDGTLVVGSGSVYFGSGTTNFGDTNLGNIQVTGGLLSADQSTKSVNVLGNILLSGGSFELASQLGGGDLFIQGNFTINGGNFNDFNRQVNFIGNNSQTVSNAPANPTGFTFSFLGVNKSGGVLTLASNVTLTRTATLTNGQVQTGNNTLFLGSNSQLNETEIGYITGKVQATQTLGGGGSSPSMFNGIGLTVAPQAGSATPGSTTVLRTTGTALVGVNGNQSTLRYYTVTPTNNTGLDLQLVFSYFIHELNATQNGAQNSLLMFGSDTGTIPFQPLYSNSDPGARTVTGYGITNLARFFAISNAANPLPVKLVSFRGQATAEGNQLRWLTAQEENFRGFEVQRQAGTADWQTLTAVPARAANGARYAYLDASAPAGLSYYRLRLVDLDGTTNYSPVVALKGSSAAHVALQLSPLPTTGLLDVATGSTEAATIRIYDLRGRLLLHTAAPAGHASVSVAPLAAGLYVLETTSAAGTQRTRFVKE